METTVEARKERQELISREIFDIVEEMVDNIRQLVDKFSEAVHYAREIYERIVEMIKYFRRAMA